MGLSGRVGQLCRNLPIVTQPLPKLGHSGFNFVRSRFVAKTQQTPSRRFMFSDFLGEFGNRPEVGSIHMVKSQLHRFLDIKLDETIADGCVWIAFWHFISGAHASR